MNTALTIAGGYLLVGVVIGVISLFIGNTIKQALWTVLAWPLALIFIVGMMGR